MPEDIYNIEFSANVQDFAAKSEGVTEDLNKVAEAVERVNRAGKKGMGGPASDYVRQIKEAQNELRQIEKMAGANIGDPYWSDAIRRKKAEIKSLQKQDRAEEARKFELQEQAVKSMAKEEKDSERELEREAAAWQKHHSRVRKQDSEAERRQKKQERQEEIAHIREVSRIRAAIVRGMYSVGLGRFAPIVNTAMQQGEGFLSGATRGIMGGRIGVPLMAAGGAALAGAGMLMTAGRAASERLIQKTPGWAESVQASQYTMPETALEKTTNMRALKLGMSTASTAVGEMLAGWFDKGIGAIKRMGPLAGGLGLMMEQWSPGGMEQAEAQERNWFMERQLQQKLSTREARLRAMGRMMGETASSIPIGAQDEMSSMGYYATAGQAAATMDARQTNQQLIDVMRQLVAVMEGKGSQQTRQALMDVFGWRGK